MACTRTVFADLILGQSWIKIYCPSKDSTNDHRRENMEMLMSAYIK